MSETYREMLRRKWPDVPVDALLEHLIEHHHGSGTVYPGREWPRPLLSNANFDWLVERGLLRRLWFFDDLGDGIQLNPEDIQHANDTGEFYHPETGEEIVNWSERVYDLLLSAPLLDELTGNKDEPEIEPADAHRTAIDLVLANISTAIADWGGHAEAVLVLKGIRASITAMRDWTPEHAAEALRETKNK